MKQDFTHKRIVVVGAGLSGQALVRFFVERGATVALSDLRRREELDGIESLAGLAVRLDLGGHDLSLFEQADLIAVSPGIPLSSAPLQRARSCGIPILGEVEIAAREIEAPLIGVTGTNGKSTTTSLIGEIMAAAERDVFVGGNLGTPLAHACGRAYDAVVVELSSFQLETIDHFHPAIGVLLNLSADHLDRYPDEDSYYRAKLALFSNMSDSDFAVLNADDPEIVRLAEEIPATRVWFSSRGRMVEGMVRMGDRLVWNWQGSEDIFSLKELKLRGEHNIENAMAAMVAAMLQGCSPEKSWEVVCSFAGLEHRMQVVRVVNNVTWINDSKGTNVGSVVKSLAGLKPGVTLIAGGKDKGGDYGPLRPLIEEKVKHLILIGEAAQKMAAELVGNCEIRLAADLPTAVHLAHVLTDPGDTVLLSPACSSFDMFRNYEERGRIFAELVNALTEKGGSDDGQA